MVRARPHERDGLVQVRELESGRVVLERRVNLRSSRLPRGVWDDAPSRLGIEVARERAHVLEWAEFETRVQLEVFDLPAR